jgi:hypothetical protein
MRLLKENEKDFHDMKKIVAYVVFSAPALTFAHPGAVDSNWCHDSPTGYHCHKWDDDETYTPEEMGITVTNDTEAAEQETAEPEKVNEVIKAVEPTENTEVQKPDNTTEIASETQATKPKKIKEPFKLPKINPYVSLGLGVQGINIDNSEDSFTYAGLSTTAKLGVEFEKTAVYILYDAAWFNEGDSIYDAFSLTGIGVSWQFNPNWYAEGGLGLGHGKLDLTSELYSSTLALDANGLSWMIGAGKTKGPWSYGLSFTQINVQSDNFDYSSKYFAAKGAYNF